MGLVSDSALVNEYMKHCNLNVRTKGYTIKDIFKDYWEDFLNDHPHLNIRDTVHLNVNRMLNCQTPKLGYSFCECPNCGFEHKSYNTCKSRFCNSCGVKYAHARSHAVTKILLPCSHRHITFTIPDSLRHYFREKRKRLLYLFEAVNMTLKYLFKKHSKSLRYQAGYILVLHTFGRALNLNPHIHCLISEGMVDIKGRFKPLKYFSYPLLRKAFMKSLLDRLHQDIGPSFYKEKSDLYTTLDDGFYVHAPSNNSNFKDTTELVKYILRYTGRPAMAQSRIIEVKDDFVTYFYEPHEDDHLPDEQRTGPIKVKEHVYEFIKKLIIHIPDYQFKMIRYYGLYSAKGMMRLSSYQRKSSYLKFNFAFKWRTLLYLSFKYDILKCRCGYYLKFIRESSYFP